MGTRLLRALRARLGEWVGAEALADELKATPADIEEAVELLLRQGYRIESGPSGHRLLAAEERLAAEAIRRDLDTRVMGRRMIVLDRTESTNDVAWKEACDGAEEGVVVFAEEQTAGRGRMGRSWWCAPSCGLLMSVILRPRLGVDHSHLLTVLASVAVCDAIREHLRLRARIRWPNDITIKARKVAGVLVEGRSLATGSAFVLGIGINVTTSVERFPAELRDTASSLAAEAQRPVARAEAARWVLRSLERWYRDLQFGDYGRIARRWRRLSSTLGERVVLWEDGREFRGRVLDLSLEDGLIVRLDEGVTRVFRAATVTLRQLP